MNGTGRELRLRNSRRKRQREIYTHILLFAGMLLVLAVIVTGIYQGLKSRQVSAKAGNTEGIQAGLYIDTRPPLDVQLLDVNEYSRPGLALKQVNGIVVHYTANPGTTAQQNRDYFNSLATTGQTYASSHFVIGLEGEIIQCIPCNEMAYASNERNSDTIAIECCIEDETGKFNKKTYDSLVYLVSWLMGQYELNTADVIRHYDVTGKNCPKYFVENPSEWNGFKDDLIAYITEYGVTKEN